MYDHSYNANTLAAAIRKGDFHGTPAALHAITREKLITEAVAAAHSNFGGANPLRKIHINGKTGFAFNTQASEIVARKATANIRALAKLRSSTRAQVVSNLFHFFKEGVPYRIYRLDIRNFYESFDTEYVIAALYKLPALNPLTRQHLETILSFHKTMGGTGLPRGLGLSATLSEFTMREFDQSVCDRENVFFFGRYVDDMIIVTSGDEPKNQFLEDLKQLLPTGLALNHTKTRVRTARSAQKISSPAYSRFEIMRIDYLGYCFKVYDPNSGKKGGYREVSVDISESKKRKIKLRINRALLDYARKPNFALLCDRIKFLSSNFSIYDRREGRRQLAGIYYNYPLLTSPHTGLKGLDHFLRLSILSKFGRVFGSSYPLLTPGQRRQLLHHSFLRGHEKRLFAHFSSSRISDIQSAWKND